MRWHHILLLFKRINPQSFYSTLQHVLLICWVLKSDSHNNKLSKTEKGESAAPKRTCYSYYPSLGVENIFIYLFFKNYNMQVWAEPDAFVPKGRWAKHCSPHCPWQYRRGQTPTWTQSPSAVSPCVCHKQELRQNLSFSLSSQCSVISSPMKQILSRIIFLHGNLIYESLRGWNPQSSFPTKVFLLVAVLSLLSNSHVHFQGNYNEPTLAFLQKRCANRIWLSWPQ